MKKLIYLVFGLFLSLSAQAQSQADIQKMMAEAQAKLKAIESNPEIAAKMKMAHHMVDSINNDSKFQKQRQHQKTTLDSLKTIHPELANVTMPNFDSMQIPSIPDFNKINATMNQSAKQLQDYTDAMNQSTPKQNLFHHTDKLPKYSASTVTVIATQLLKSIKPKLDPLTLRALTLTLNDTSINVASTGAFLLASGANPDAAMFLICESILKNPKDPWAVNDLGVYFRDQKDLEKSLQCHLYANSLDTGHNTAINTNIGWASAYYGDFDAANKYFDKALQVNKDFQSANEGAAMVAYAKGDIAALFKCLSKEIKTMGESSGGDAGPSAAFSSSASNIATQQNAQNGNNPTTDPSDDHTFDNSLPDNATDPPPGADVDDITLSRYKKAFVNKPEDIGQGIMECEKEHAKSYEQMNNTRAQLMQQLKSLPPLSNTPYKDDEGYIHYPNSFARYLDLLPAIQESFTQRLSWEKTQLVKKLVPLGASAYYHDMDMINMWDKNLGACKDDEECKKGVNCEWLPRIYKSKNSDLEAVSRLWDDYYDHVAASIQWYINATAPIVSRVHQEGWNDYLNATRKYRVQMAIVQAYGLWKISLGEIATSMCAYVKPPMPECPPLQMGLTKAPDPFSKKPKHIKEFEGPCYDQNYPIFLGTGIEKTCHGEKFYIGGGPFKAFYNRTSDQIMAQNQGQANQLGLDVSVSKEIEIAKIGENPVNVTLGVEGTVDLEFNSDWNLQKGSTSVSATADMGHLQLAGIAATRNAEMINGALVVNPVSVVANGPTIK